MAFTLTQFRQFLADYDRSNGSTRQQRVYDKIANDCTRECYSLGDYDFATRNTRLSFAALYNTGTVSITAGAAAVTGSGTTFTSSMVGRYIRFNGENEQYKITAYGSATSITIETYLGTSNLSGVTYVITDERKAMPSLFRSVRHIFLNPATGSRTGIYPINPVSFHELELHRRVYQTSDYPGFYATKFEEPTSGNVPAGYIHVYPPSSINLIANVYYTVWPTLVSNGTDELPVPYELESVIRSFGLAYLALEDGSKDWVTMMQRAKEEGFMALGDTRAITAFRQKQEWVAPGTSSHRHWPQIDPTILSQMDA